MLSRSYVIVLLLLIVSSAFAQDNSVPQTALKTIETVVMEMRQLDLLRDPARSFLSREAATEAYVREALAEWSADDAARSYLLYRALDLAEPGLNLPALYLDFLTNWISGYYDPDDETIYVITPAGPPDAGLSFGQEVTYVHEFVHALQDQHFNLDEFMASNNSENSLDGWLALSALVEGDASLIQMEYMFQLFEDGDERVPREPPSADDLPPEPPEELPRVILGEIDFLYWEGREFAQELFAERGWAGINRAFREAPPTTTEQIMHPQRYLKGEGAKEVSIPDHSSLIGEGWRLGYDGPVGEFILLAHLETQLRPPHSERYAAGWGGDRLLIYTAASEDDMIWVWAQAWDRANDAKEFAEGYTYFLDKRYFGRYQRERVDEQCWVNSDTTHCFARISETETRISMAADKTTALALLAPGA